MSTDKWSRFRVAVKSVKHEPGRCGALLDPYDDTNHVNPAPTTEAKTAEVPVVGYGYQWYGTGFQHVFPTERPQLSFLGSALVRQSDMLAAMEALRQERQSAIEAERASWLKQEAQSTAEVLALRAEVAARDAHYLRLLKAAIDMLAAVDSRHDKEPAPLKYSVPYGALNALRAAALYAEPTKQPGAIPVGDHPGLLIKRSEWESLSPAAQEKLMSLTVNMPRERMAQLAQAAEDMRNQVLVGSRNPAPHAAVPEIQSPCTVVPFGAESVGGSLVHPDDAARAGAAIGNNFDPMR